MENMDVFGKMSLLDKLVLKLAIIEDELVHIQRLDSVEDADIKRISNYIRLAIYDLKNL